MNDISVAFNTVSKILSVNFTVVGISVNLFSILITLLLSYLLVAIIGYILGD